MKKNEFQIQDIIQILKKRWKIISVFVLIAIILESVFNFYIIPPKYESNAKLFIGKSEVKEEGYNANDVQLYQKLLNTYAEIIKTDDLIETALSKNNMDIPVGAVLSGLDIKPIANTQILQISYRCNDANLSKKILDTVIQEFISESKDLISNGTVKIIQASKLPIYPVSPDKFKNIAIGIIISFMLGVILAFWLEYINDTVKTKEQIEEIIGIPVIGLIPIE